jgi:hypothetical protein
MVPIAPRWLKIGLVILAAGSLTAAACTPAALKKAAEKLPTLTPTSARAVTATPTSRVVIYATPQPTPTLSVMTPTPTPTPIPELTTATPTPPPGVAMPARPANENPLTGLAVSDPAVLQRRPIHVRVGNDPGARPQAGLSSADLVYEEIVEWWVTRFTAMYLGESPEVVAPIRSARLINTQLTQQYNAALANSGGSDGVRWELSQTPIVNLDEYFWPQPYFYRKNEGWQTRLALNVKAARELMAGKDMESPVTLRGFVFSDAPVGGQPAGTIFIPYPKRTSRTEWRYDAGSGRYLRWLLDEPLIDSVTNQQISAANVILYYADHQKTNIVEDSNGATSIRIIVNGEGRAQVFRDGVVIEGRWRTDGAQTPEFIFPNGELIPLKRGNSWIEVAPNEYQVLVNGSKE